MIRSSKHSIKFLNSQKKEKYLLFINEYRRVSKLILDDIWENGYENFNVKQDQLNLPLYLDYNKFNIQTNLSARVLRCLTTQVSSIVRGVCRKRKKKLYCIKQYNHSSNNLSKLTFSKPNIDNIIPELNSICADIIKGNGFNWFLQLKSLSKEYGKIRIPLKANKVSNKWGSKGQMLNSFGININYISIRYKIEPKNNNQNNQIIAIDQGLNSVATLSDGQITPKTDNHGHSLNSILDKMSRKRKGSKAFRKCRDHRKNFINWSINKLNLNAKEIRLEKIVNIFHGKKRSRKLSHWTNTLIRDKIKRRAEELEVPVIEQDSSYRSQRCSNCGLVRKSNRNGAKYKCKNCGFEANADYNASLNHLSNLPPIDFTFRSLKKNLKNGFFWKSEGCFLNGEEFTVPFSKNKNHIWFNCNGSWNKVSHGSK